MSSEGFAEELQQILGVRLLHAWPDGLLRGLTDSFVDFIEDHLVRHGEPVASTAEIKAWLEQGVDEILAQHAKA